MISKGCLYQKVRVQDLDFEIPTIESVFIVSEYTKVFHNGLLGIPPEWEIDFGIELLSDTNRLSIPPYRMALAELKELKAQLKNLQDKGFIRPSNSP